jgi:hypothetical protein
MRPTVFAQPKSSSISLRLCCDIASPRYGLSHQASPTVAPRCFVPCAGDLHLLAGFDQLAIDNSGELSFMIVEGKFKNTVFNS